MLKNQGFSLLEMIISTLILNLIIIGTSTFYQQLHATNMNYYLNTHLKQNIEHAVSGLFKDIKRAGFIANSPSKINQKSIEINDKNNCIIIRYDSEIRHYWIDDPQHLNNSDIFSYRFYQNNLEYKTGAMNCQGTNWQKIFDPNDIKVTKFVIKQNNNTIEMTLAAELKKHHHISHQIFKIIRNENRL